MRDAFLPLFFFAASSLLIAQAEDLVTRDGTVYHDYKVLSHDAGYLTIMYGEGGGKIPLSNLPEDLQKKYGYDKAQADAFVQASVAQDRQNRQAIANEQVQNQQQAVARALAQASAEGTTAAGAIAVPPGSSTSPTGGVIPPNLPPPGPAPVGSSPAATNAPVPASQGEIDALRQKIRNVKTDIISLKLELKGAPLNDRGAAGSKLNADINSLAALNRQLSQMEGSQLPQKLSWDDVSAIHQQIVGILDDIAIAQHDANPDDFVSQLKCQDRVADDQDQIDQLRRTLKLSIRPPLTLSPGELAALRQKRADAKTEIDYADRERLGGTGLTMSAIDHQYDEATELDAELGEKLETAQQSTAPTSH